MPRFRILLSIVVLIASLVLLFDKLFTPQPIRITLESGQEVTTTSPEYFSIAEVLFLIVSAFLIGTCATYLFYNSDRSPRASPPKQAAASSATYDIILPLLKGDEKRVIAALREGQGEMLQNKLVAKLGLSKVKVTRLLVGLEHKRLISKERHGLTNLVKLSR
jgi:uncharacterized membrane protein